MPAMVATTGESTGTSSSGRHPPALREKERASQWGMRPPADFTTPRTQVDEQRPRSHDRRSTAQKRKIGLCRSRTVRERGEQPRVHPTDAGQKLRVHFVSFVLVQVDGLQPTRVRHIDFVPDTDQDAAHPGRVLTGLQNHPVLIATPEPPTQGLGSRRQACLLNDLSIRVKETRVHPSVADVQSHGDLPIGDAVDAHGQPPSGGRRGPGLCAGFCTPRGGWPFHRDSVHRRAPRKPAPVGFLGRCWRNQPRNRSQFAIIPSARPLDLY